MVGALLAATGCAASSGVSSTSTSQYRLIPRLALLLASYLSSWSRSAEHRALLRVTFLLLDTVLPHTDLAYQLQGTRHVLLSVITRLAIYFFVVCG